MSVGSISSIDQGLADQIEAVRNSTNATVKTKNQNTLGQADFFNLITTQLTNQNPLEPMKDTDFIAQMANFSSLEQMANLNKNFEQFSESQIGLAAQTYLGKTVSLVDDAGKNIQGTVTEVNLSAEGTEISVNGTSYPVDRVNRVRLPQVP